MTLPDEPQKPTTGCCVDLAGGGRTPDRVEFRSRQTKRRTDDTAPCCGHLSKALAPIDIAIIARLFPHRLRDRLLFCALRGRTSADYFLASRNVGWFAIGASLFVSNISTEHFIGLAGSGATSGLAVGHFEWLACLILLVLGLGVRAVLPALERVHDARVPGARFNRACSVYLGSISILAYVFTKISVHLYAGRDRARARGRLGSDHRGRRPRDRDRDLHDHRGPGRGDLHRARADADPAGGGRRAHGHRPRRGRRIRGACAPPCRSTTSA